MIEKLGKYQILEQIGAGGMGAVYRASDPLLKRVVALKVISENVDKGDERRARFFREARACAQLSHPNIITIYDLGEDQGRLFIVMEYLEGKDLRQTISQRRDLTLESKLTLMIQVCEGLAYAHHRGIVHRDIKPGNIFIVEKGTAKILDFGLARIASMEEDLTQTGLFIGTLRYMAPEQARGRVDQRTDMFAAAAVFYELVAHHPPLPFDHPMAVLEELHSPTSPSRFRPDAEIPEDLGAVLERALRTDPEQRFPDMTEMRSALGVVRNRLAQEAASLRRRLESQAVEVHELCAHLSEQVDGKVAYEMPAVPADRECVVALKACFRSGEDVLARLREQIEHASRLRPDYERARDRMRLGQWTAAQELFESVLSEISEHVGAREGLTQARAGARRAAEIEQERQAAVGAEQSMDEQRRRIAPSVMGEGGKAWDSAEACRLDGLAALAEQSYRRASEQFEAAATQYKAVADSVEQRVRPLLQGSRQRLEERQFAECLKSVHEALRLMPDNSEALALNLEAERGAQEERVRQTALDERCSDACVKLAGGDVRGAIDVLTAVVREEPGHARAHQILDKARAQMRAEEQAQLHRSLEDTCERSSVQVVVQRGTEHPEDATVLLERVESLPLRSTPNVPAEGADEGLSVVSPVANMPRASREDHAPGLPRFRGRVLMLIVTGLLLVASAVSLEIASSRRLRSEVNRVRQQVGVAREDALKVEADRLAQGSFKEATAKSLDGEQQASNGSLRVAAETLRGAAAQYEESARIARGVGAERAKADEARAVMLSAKKGASRETREYEEAVAYEG